MAGLFCSVLEFGPVPTSPTPVSQLSVSISTNIPKDKRPLTYCTTISLRS
jgi:hypothetical protein